MAAERYLIVNADDFGQSLGVNRGVITAHEQGIVTSASLMVRWPAAAEAAAYCREHSRLSLGLHVDLGEWTYRDATWVSVYEVASADHPEIVANEITRQLATFRRLVGRDPSHLDSHQHVHREEPVRSVLVRLARQLAIPLRQESPQVRYYGHFYGQTTTGSPIPEAISVPALVKILAALPPGWTELSCHPGEGHDPNSMYCSERAQEVKVLCDAHVRAVIVAEGIKLCSFSDLLARRREGVNWS